MRVISGQARGRRLKAPKGFHTRPTADRVKEAIFNVLSPKVNDSRVLDLFAGTGALGIESLSRGAKEAVFVDNNQQAVQNIKENISLTGFGSQSRVLFGTFSAQLNQLEGKFDIIFIDPPYNKGLIEPAVRAIADLDLLHSEGVIVVETNAKLREVPQDARIDLVKESVYGDTAVLYYQLI